MIGRLSTFLPLVVLGAALLAGCGGGSSSSAGTSTLTSSTSSTSNPSVATGTSATSKGNAPTPTPQQEVVLCQRAVDAIKTLPVASKARLKSSCEKVGTGQAGKQQVAREVCLELAAQLASPEGRARAQRICRAP